MQLSLRKQLLSVGERAMLKQFPSLMRARSCKFRSSKRHICEKLFDAFPEVLLLETTYQTNKLRMPLFVFVVEDGAGHSHVVTYAFVASQQQHVVTQLLDIFVRENTTPSRTSAAVVDKGFTEISAVRETFPSKPSVQLCQFHVTKAFKVLLDICNEHAVSRSRY